MPKRKPSAAAPEIAASPSASAASPQLSPELVNRIAAEIGAVMFDLHALALLAPEAEQLPDAFIFPALAEAVLQRSYVRLDRCAVKLGAMEGGYFQSDPLAVREKAEEVQHAEA